MGFLPSGGGCLCSDPFSAHYEQGGRGSQNNLEHLFPNSWDHQGPPSSFPKNLENLLIGKVTPFHSETLMSLWEVENICPPVVPDSELYCELAVFAARSFYEFPPVTRRTDFIVDWLQQVQADMAPFIHHNRGALTEFPYCWNTWVAFEVSV